MNAVGFTVESLSAGRALEKLRREKTRWKSESAPKMPKKPLQFYKVRAII